MTIKQLVQNRQPLDAELRMRIKDAVNGIQVTEEELRLLTLFLDEFSHLLIANLSNKDTCSLRNKVSEVIDSSSLSNEWKWSEVFFVRKAVDGEQFDEELTTGREARVCLLFRYFAEYVNNHQNLLEKPLLSWALWNYEDYFTQKLKLEESYIDNLLEEIKSDDLISSFRSISRFDAEYYLQQVTAIYPSEVAKWEALVEGSDYGELPQWIEYISCYLQKIGNIELQGKLFHKLSYPLLQSTLSYQVLSPEITYNLLLNENDGLLSLVYLEMWHRNMCRCGSTLQLYQNENKSVREELLKEGRGLFKEWEEEISISVESVVQNYVSKHNWPTFFDWNFSHLHRQGSGLYSNEIREMVDTAILKQLKQAFQPKLLTSIRCSKAFVQFVCEENLEKFGEDKVMWDWLREVIEHLFDDIHERPLPKFEANSLPLWRGYAYAFVNTEEKTNEAVMNKLNEVRAYFEGYQHEEDSRKMLEKIYRESFILSSFMLIAEREDIPLETTSSIFSDIVNRTFMQIYAAFDAYIREPYLVPLQLSILVSSQLMKDQYEGILYRVANEIPDLYEAMTVLRVAKEMDEKTKTLLKERWEQEKDVIEIRSKQINMIRQFEDLKQWTEGL